MSNIEREIAQRIEAFVTDLNEIMRRQALDAVAEALGDERGRNGRGAPGRRGGAATSARRKGAKRPAELLAKTQTVLFDHIKKNPGQRIEEIGKALRIPTKDLSLPAKKLLATKKIATKGQKRATTYFPA